MDRDIRTWPYFKITREDGSPHHGGSGKWIPGEWRSVEPPVRPCAHGLHIVTFDNILHWAGPALWMVEVHPDAQIDTSESDKVVVSKARILERVETWSPTNLRLFAADRAESVLHIFEAKRPNDDRPRKAVEAARLFALGRIDATALRAARSAAHAADAAYAAAYAAYAAYAAAYAAYAAYAAAADAAYYADDAAYAGRASRAESSALLMRWLSGERTAEHVATEMGL